MHRGVERARRSNISRCLQGAYGLNSTQYDRVNFYKNEASTSDWHVAGLLLLPRQDWRKRLLEKNEKFCSKYTKLIQIAMDLSNEVQHIQKLHNFLFKVSKSVEKLTSYYRSGRLDEF
jgi:hypothetical protein